MSLSRTTNFSLQAEYGDEAVKQLRQREAEERRAARAAREQGDIDVNQIPLGEKVCYLPRHQLQHGPPAAFIGCCNCCDLAAACCCAPALYCQPSLYYQVVQ